MRESLLVLNLAAVAACASFGTSDPDTDVMLGDCQVKVTNRSGGPLEIMTRGGDSQNRGLLPTGQSLIYEAPCSEGRQVITATRRSGPGAESIFTTSEDVAYQSQAAVQTVALRPGEVVEVTFRRVGGRRR